MITTFWGIVRDGKIEVPSGVPFEEGAKVLVTELPREEDDQFWLKSSESALDSVWSNEQDDIYAQLLSK